MIAGHQAIGSTEPSAAVTIRRATSADAEVCGRICFDAFSQISARHNFPSDFPAPDICIGIFSFLLSHPGFFCVVAEQNGKVVRMYTGESYHDRVK
jgi:hypothetical protein